MTTTPRDAATTPDLTVQIAATGKQSLALRNPVMTASGTFANAVEFAHAIDVQRLGAVVSKACALQPRGGNPTPRTVETPAGMLNSIGLQGIGIDALLRDVAPVWATWRVPAIVNIVGERIDEYAELARRCDGVPGIAAIEVNISCPNVENGLEFGSSPHLAAQVTQAVRHNCGLPVIVKLTPNADAVAVARAVQDAGADALCVANTLLGMAIDVRTRHLVLPRGSGGLSGPAVKPIILRLVWEVYRVAAVPIIASGGIARGVDALEYILAGASAVQVGTASFRDPNAALTVLDELTELLAAQGVTRLSEIVGAAHGTIEAHQDGV
ncbi:MAG: dihydroorotate dehydrogenase [Dehalococcoidia bacterium]|nr:dihydroorotate dehydrogenase [Dehalococcoidia bacterium]